MTTVQIDTNSKDADHVMFYLEGNSYTQTIKGACELEVFDELVAGPKTAAQIAGPKDWSVPALDKLLSMCAAMGLVQKTKKGEQYEYSLLGPGRLLVKNGPPALYESGCWGGGSGHLTNLADQVKKVKSQSTEAWDEENWEPDVESHRMLEGMAMCYMNAVIGAIDCSKYKTAVDLGAGTGVAGVVICRLNPQMSVVLNDKPAVLKLAKDHFIPADLGSRITYLPGDFFEIDLPQTDLFVGSMVVKHMDEPTIKKLLKILMKKLNSGGTVAFIDSLFSENKDGPLLTMVWSMMEGLTPTYDVRPASFYIRVLQEEGFTDVKVVQTQERCNYNLICGKKP